MEELEEQFGKLKRRSTLQIEQLESEAKSCNSELKSRILQIEEMNARLTFLLFKVNIEDASSGVPPTDVTILVGERTDEPVHAHKLILCDKSPVIQKMFETGMKETETGVIRIDDVRSVPVMQAVVKFCYRAQIDFTDEVTAEEVFPVAHKYGIDFLQAVCEENLIKTIDSVNLVRRLKLAKTFHAEQLKVTALEYLKSHFDEVKSSLLDEAF